MSNSNRETVVKLWSGYSRETSGNIFSSRSVLQIGSVYRIMKEPPDILCIRKIEENVQASKPIFRTVEARCLKY